MVLSKCNAYELVQQDTALRVVAYSSEAAHYCSMIVWSDSQHRWCGQVRTGMTSVEQFVLPDSGQCHTRDALACLRSVSGYGRDSWAKAGLCAREKKGEQCTEACADARDALVPGPSVSHERLVANSVLVKTSGGGNIYQCGAPHNNYMYKE
eukprot:10059375-Lingulodinium_polyedra.AAC.1